MLYVIEYKIQFTKYSTR